MINYNLGRTLFGLFACALLATLQMRFTVEVLSVPNFIESLKAVIGVLEGRPHWLVYQARLLGPWSVYWLGEVIGNIGFAYALFIAIGFFAANIAFSGPSARCVTVFTSLQPCHFLFFSRFSLLTTGGSMLGIFIP